MAHGIGNQEEPEVLDSIRSEILAERKPSVGGTGSSGRGRSSRSLAKRGGEDPVRLGTLQIVLIGLGGLVVGGLLAAGLLALYLYLTGSLP